MVDAIGTKTKIAKTIIEQGGDYILAVKENQGHLYEDIHDLFADNQQFNYEDIPHSYAKVVKKIMDASRFASAGQYLILSIWPISGI